MREDFEKGRGELKQAVLSGVEEALERYFKAVDGAGESSDELARAAETLMGDTREAYRAMISDAIELVKRDADGP